MRDFKLISKWHSNIPQDISATINGYIENQWLILINLTYATVCQILEIIGF